jgi:beta-glucanase (GH16 family)
MKSISKKYFKLQISDQMVQTILQSGIRVRPVKNLLYIIPVVFCIICGSSKSTSSYSDKKTKWDLIWSDEFNYTGLPDTSKWNYEEGFVRNGELQYYTKARKENVRIEGGNLVIEARKEKIENPKFHPDSTRWQYARKFAEYTSGSINTRGKASFKFGRMEARIQVPHGSGMWPAFWTVGDQYRWPKSGEIDILEYFGGERPNRIESNMHYEVAGKHNHRQGVFETQGPPKGFHIYAIEWFNDRVDFYFDDNRYWSFAIDVANDGDFNAYRNPHHILLNFALGGVPHAGSVDESLLPQKYLVDYVRVYKLR